MYILFSFRFPRCLRVLYIVFPMSVHRTISLSFHISSSSVKSLLSIHCYLIRYYIAVQKYLVLNLWHFILARWSLRIHWYTEDGILHSSSDPFSTFPTIFSHVLILNFGSGRHILLFLCVFGFLWPICKDLNAWDISRK